MFNDFVSCNCHMCCNCRAAALDMSSMSSLEMSRKNSYISDVGSAPLTAASASIHSELSINNNSDGDVEPETGKSHMDLSEDESMDEIVIQVGENAEKSEKSMIRQPSTTEYLPGMVHTLSPAGALYLRCFISNFLIIILYFL